MTLKAISWSYPWLTWIITTALLSIRFSVKHQSTEQTVDSCSKWHKGHLESNSIAILIITMSIWSHCSRFHIQRVHACVYVWVNAFLSEFRLVICVRPCVSLGVCVHAQCGCLHVCDCDQNSPGFRFLSCSTDSHLAPVPKMVILEKRNRWKKKWKKAEIFFFFFFF